MSRPPRVLAFHYRGGCRYRLGLVFRRRSLRRRARNRSRNSDRIPRHGLFDPAEICRQPDHRPENKQDGRREKNRYPLPESKSQLFEFLDWIGFRRHFGPCFAVVRSEPGCPAFIAAVKLFLLGSGGADNGCQVRLQCAEIVWNAPLGGQSRQESSNPLVLGKAYGEIPAVQFSKKKKQVFGIVPNSYFGGRQFFTTFPAITPSSRNLIRVPNVSVTMRRSFSKGFLSPAFIRMAWRNAISSAVEGAFLMGGSAFLK